MRRKTQQQLFSPYIKMSNHSEKCIADENEQIKTTRQQFGLANSSLGGSMIASDSTLVIIGFFTSALSQIMSSAAPDNRKLHVAINAVCISVLLFKSIQLFVDQTSVILWRLSRDFTFTLFRFLKFVCSLTLILTSHFITDILFEELGTGMSWVESAAIMIAAVLTIYLVLQLFHVNSSI